MSSVRNIYSTALSTSALGALILMASAGGGHAQTAADYNRAAAAMQLCASPAGAAIPQCAQLKQQLGAGAGAGASQAAGVAGALNALANARGGGAGGLAGVLSGLANSAASANTANVNSNSSAAAAQAAYAACVQKAGLNTGAIQACSSIVANWSGGATGVAAGAGSGDYYVQSANATHAAAANYQACVAANPANWQACLAPMTGAGPSVAAAAVNLSGAALAGYQRCLQTNPAEKCAKAYGATPAAAPAAAGNGVANAAAAAQTAQQLAPTLKALGSLLGSR